MNRIIVTGGAGFIGSAVARHIVLDTQDAVCVVDKLTYAGNLENLAQIANDPRFKFEKVDICNKTALDRGYVWFLKQNGVKFEATLFLSDQYKCKNNHRNIYFIISSSSQPIRLPFSESKFTPMM